MTASILARNTLSNIKKDFRVEFRNRYALNVSISFAAISTMAVSLTLGGAPISIMMQSILFWIILFFSAMNGLSHIFIREEEQGTSLFLRLNATPDVVLTSKLIFNISLFFVLQVVITPLFIFFLQMEIRSILPFIANLLAGGFALTSSTTILAAIVAKAGGRGSLFTVISFPLTLPVLWTSINATLQSLEDPLYSGYGNLIFLLAFSGALISLSYILFEYIWMDE